MRGTDLFMFQSLGTGKSFWARGRFGLRFFQGPEGGTGRRNVAGAGLFAGSRKRQCLWSAFFGAEISHTGHAFWLIALRGKNLPSGFLAASVLHEKLHSVPLESKGS